MIPEKVGSNSNMYRDEAIDIEAVLSITNLTIGQCSSRDTIELVSYYVSPFFTHRPPSRFIKYKGKRKSEDRAIRQSHKKFKRPKKKISQSQKKKAQLQNTTVIY